MDKCNDRKEIHIQTTIQKDVWLQIKQVNLWSLLPLWSVDQIHRIDGMRHFVNNIPVSTIYNRDRFRHSQSKPGGIDPYRHILYYTYHVHQY